MEYQGIVITGTSGAGKSTIARTLCEKHDNFQLVEALTTREQREDDYAGMYQYISKDELETLEADGELLTKAEYRGDFYAIANQAFQRVLDNGKVPVLVLTPESTNRLDVGNTEFITIFLDASDPILDTRLAQRREQIKGDFKKQREVDREYAKNCLCTSKKAENGGTESIAELVKSLWDYRNTGGMLPQRLIKLMISCGVLLEQADLDNIQGASYDLTLGDYYYQEGSIKHLSTESPFITIGPGDFALVASRETTNFPRHIAGRFDLTVSMFFKGLILSNGPQVDPGYKGRLFCLLFNTSNDEIHLKQGDHYATIEFIKLIEPTIPYAGQHQDKDTFKEYLPKKVKSSVISEIRKDINGLKSERWWTKTLPLVITLLAVIITIALAIIVFRGT